jgi:hypothetical protein
MRLVIAAIGTSFPICNWRIIPIFPFENCTIIKMSPQALNQLSMSQQQIFSGYDNADPWQRGYIFIIVNFSSIQYFFIAILNTSKKIWIWIFSC